MAIRNNGAEQVKLLFTYFVCLDLALHPTIQEQELTRPRHIYEDNGLFMRERLDAHFEIKALSLLHKNAVGVRYYTQGVLP